MSLNKEQVNNLFDKGVDISQIREEVYFLMECIKDTNINKILETGTHYGGTAKIFEQLILNQENVRDPFLITIDIDGSRQDWDFNSSIIPIEFIEGDSINPDIYNKVINYLKNRKLDFIYLDGSHKYENVVTEVDLYCKFLRKDGILALNDIYPREKGVHKAWNELKEKTEVFEFIGEQVNWTGTGVLRKII